MQCASRKIKQRTTNSPITVHCRLIYVIAQSLFLLQQEETLPGLPFLVGVFAGGCLQKVVIIRDRRRRFVQCIVRCCPEKVRRGNIRKIF